VHGGAAAAAAVSGLGASAAGTAAITGTFGMVGMGHAGSKTAALVSEVRDMGFWDLSEAVTLDPATELGAEAPGGSSSGSSSGGGGGRAGGSEGGSREVGAGAEQQGQRQLQPAKSSSWQGWFGSGTKSAAPQADKAADTAQQQQQQQQQAAGSSSPTSSDSVQRPPSARGSASGSPAKPPAAKSRRRSGQPPAYRPLLPVPVNPRKKAGASLSLTIAVNGWVSCPGDYAAPWRHLPGGGCDRMALVWERDLLQQLGVALSQFIKNKAVEESGKMVGGAGEGRGGEGRGEEGRGGVCACERRWAQGRLATRHACPRRLRGAAHCWPGRGGRRISRLARCPAGAAI
jgi:hypothetical protein